MENKFVKINQLGIVTDKPAEEIIESMRKLFGVEPDMINGTKEDDGRMYKGEFSPFAVKNVNYRFANVEIQFSCPNEAPSSWRDWLDKHGTSIHRIGFNVNNWDEAVAQMENGGAPLIQKGNGLHGIPGGYFGYCDTEEQLGFITGFTNRDQIKDKQMTAEQKETIWNGK